MKILVPGGAGYIGAVLVPHLLADGHEVTVYDTLWFGNGALPDNGNLTVIKADVRSHHTFREACKGQDAVIYLASISNNAMCEQYKLLSETININSPPGALFSAKAAGVKRFIYASSVAAYGSSDHDAREDERLVPSTMYGEGKMIGERWTHAASDEKFTCTITRSASVCGYSPHQRFDLTVNKMVHDAMTNGVITVNGGAQKRSHIHMFDICRAYRLLLNVPVEDIASRTFNFVAENQSVIETAQIVAEETGAAVSVGPSTDDRSYTVDGSRARDVLGFIPNKTVRQAVRELKARFDSDATGLTKYFHNSQNDPAFQNVAHGLS